MEKLRHRVANYHVNDIPKVKYKSNVEIHTLLLQIFAY